MLVDITHSMKGLVMSRILVTGAAGFIGSHVAQLLAKNHKVFALDNLSSTGDWKNLFNSPLGLVGVNDTSILDAHYLSKLVGSWKIDAVVHLAAQPSLQTSWKAADIDAQTNIVGTINLLGLCQRYKVKRFVFASTSAVYAPREDGFYSEDSKVGPQTPYGVSKAAAEHYIRISGIPYVILRLGNVYGPRQVPLGENQLIPRALTHIYQDEPFEIYGDGEQKRDFVYVRDVARAFVDSVRSNVEGTFNIATGDSHSVNSVLKYIYYRTHFAGLGELIGNEDPAWSSYWKHGSAKPKELQKIILSCELAERSLGWIRSTGIHLGIQKTIEAWPKE